MTSAELLKRLIENAIDFLVRAIDEFEAKPKYSIINFHSAVELFLKARLMADHWSLVVMKDPDRARFEAGDFVSVTFEAACERLQKIVQSPVPEGARRNFDSIRKHRNKMVHFFHEADHQRMVSVIAEEQLRAWYDLQKLLTGEWRDVFQEHKDDFEAIEQTLKGHRKYLQAKFEDRAGAISEAKSKGVVFRACGSCGFDAARIDPLLGDLLSSDCLVCGYEDIWFDYKCPACQVVSPLEEGGRFDCECGHVDEVPEIADQITDLVIDKDNYYEARGPGHCGVCEGFHSVVEYREAFVCVQCFDLPDELAPCAFCGELSSGDMEQSYLHGCGHCDGSMGWARDKDD